MIERFVIGVVVSAMVSVAGWRTGALTGTGAAVAVLVGTAIVVGTSWAGAAILGAFFVVSSALSHAHSNDGFAEKGSRRDAVQVFANGGVAGIGALAGVAGYERLALALVATAIAAATADTWATEIGATSRSTPRMLLSRREVERGQSGGVTVRGTLGALGGASFIGALAGGAATIRFTPETGLTIALLAVLGGLVGATIDSLLGETIQEQRYCPACEKLTEARVHHCGTGTVYRDGIAGVNNDVVNGLCTLCGGCTGLLVLLV